MLDKIFASLSNTVALKAFFAGAADFADSM